MSITESPLAPVAEARAIVGDLNKLADLIEQEGFEPHRDVVEGLLANLKYAVEEAGGSLPEWVERQMLPPVKAVWAQWTEANPLSIESRVKVWIRTPFGDELPDPNLPFPI